MRVYFGVKCAICKVPMVLHEVVEDPGKTIMLDVVPLHELECTRCGHKRQYGSENGFRFHLGDSTPTDRAR